MKNLYSLPLFVLLLAMTAPVAAQNNADDIVGFWWTKDQEAKVQIYRQGSKYYGKIIELKNPRTAEGELKRDKNNPKAELRSRPIEGIIILKELEYDGDGAWEDGNIYDPKSGNDYSCDIEMEDRNTLNVRGYLGFSLLGRSQTWKRAE